MMKFPEDLLWGSASADFQYEGGFNEGGRGLLTCDFVTDGSLHEPRKMTYKTKDGTIGIAPMRSSIPQDAIGYIDPNQYYPSHAAVDFYHRYQEDIELLAKMGMTTMRFSICWSRIFPTGEELEPNQAGIDFYAKVIDECLKWKIEPLVTICHDEIPVVLADKYDGWSSRVVIDCYLRLCEVLFENFGSKVKYWLTFNEVNALSGYSHLGVRNVDDQTTLQAIHHVFVASAKAQILAKKMMPDAQLGAMYASSPTYPATCKPEDVMAWVEQRRNLFYFSDVMVRGYYPGYAKSYLDARGVTLAIAEGDAQILKDGALDFYAFSCYRSSIVGKDTKLGHYGMSFEANPYVKQSTWGWGIDPMSVRFVLNEVYERYQKPLFIVENGLGEIDKIDENHNVADTYRIDYLKDHFQEIKKAVEIDGIPVIGYTMWGGIDLVSLSTGEMKKRYGFVYVDMDDKGHGTKNRYLKASYYWMQEFLKTNGENLI